MADQRTGRREDRRSFRPTLDGKLEPRVLMAAHLAAIRAQTAANGEAVVITNTEGARFFVSVNFGGTVRATAASGGRVNLIVDGSTPASLLEISQIVPAQLRNSAHTFNTSQSAEIKKLNLASVTITSGMINAIEGYQTANLSGPLVVSSSTRVDRIALNSILAGGSITTGGDLNTLDVYSNIEISNTGSISIGRDLNWFETYGNVTIDSGGYFVLGRDLGTTLQPAKGSGNAGQGINITGNLSVASGAAFAVGRNIPYPAGIVIGGNLTGYNNIAVAGVSLLTYLTQVKPSQGQPPNVLVNGLFSVSPPQ